MIYSLITLALDNFFAVAERADKETGAHLQLGLNGSRSLSDERLHVPRRF